MLHLLRASGLAIDPRKMLLGGLALALLAVGEWLFGFLPFASNTVTIHFGASAEPSLISRLLGCLGFGVPRIESWMSWDAAAFALLIPVRTLIAPARVIFQSGHSWSELAFAWTQLLWSLIVWSLAGGALCRMSALQFAVRKRIGLLKALSFARRQLLAYLIAPLLPLSAVLILLGFNYLLGYLASLTSPVGEMAIGLGWCVVLFSGFLMAMLVLGVLTGWPLMIAAISTEDSDGFDGLSRAFGYLFDRPWHAVLSACLSLPVFAVTRFLVALLIGLTVSLGTDAIDRGFEHDSLYSGIRMEPMNWSQWPAVNPAGRFVEGIDRTLTGRAAISLPGRNPELMVFAWTCIPALLYAGFGSAFFWSATTVTYFLLRRSDDGTPLNEVTDWSETRGPDDPQSSEDQSVQRSADDASRSEADD